MPEQEKDVVITISAKNLTEAEFLKVTRGLGGIEKKADATSKKTNVMTRSFKAFGQAVPGALKAVAIGATAIVGAATGAAIAIAKLAEHGNEVVGVETSFKSLAAAAGESSNEIISKTSEASRGLVTNMEIMTASNKGLLLGLPITADSMANLSKTAIVLGKAMKQDAATSLNDLITGLGRASPLILDNLGITVKAGEANQLYAAQLGKSVKELTDAEKKTAFYNAAMTAAQAKVAELGESQLTLSERFQQTKVFLTNLLDGISAGIAQSPVFSAAISKINEMLQEAFGGKSQNLITTVVQLIERGAFFFFFFGQAMISAAQFILQGWAGIKVVVLETALAIGTFQQKILETVASVAEVASVLPGVGELYGAVGDKASMLAGQVATVNENLRASSEDAHGAALGNDALGQALTSTSAVLETVNQEMVNVGTTQSALNQTTAENVNLTNRAAEAATNWSAKLEETTPFFDAHMQKLRETNLTIALLGDQTTFQMDRIKNDVGSFVPVVTGVGDVTASQTKRMAENFAFFGERTVSELEKTAIEAEERFNEIEASGAASAEELLRIWEEVEEAKRAAQGETETFTLSSNEAILTGSSQVLNQLGGKYKAAAIAQAVIATGQAVAKSLASAPWPASLVLAAGALAAGIANVNKIRSAAAFQEGTENLDFQNFGPRTFAELHGQEAVVPQGGGHQLGREVASELARMRPAESGASAELGAATRELRALPGAIQRAVRDAMLLAG